MEYAIEIAKLFGGFLKWIGLCAALLVGQFAAYMVIQWIAADIAG